MKKLITTIALVALCAVLLVACNGEKVDTGLAAAKEYLQGTYKDAAELTASDFTRLGMVKIEGVSYTVEWTVSVTSGSADDVKVEAGQNGMVTINVNEKAAADVAYTLTATIKNAEGKTETLTYNHKVPAFKEMTFEQYVAAEKDAPVVVKGVVTGIISKKNGASNNCLYLSDKDGGYYIYGLSTDPVEDGIKIGMTIRATGIKDNYNGTLEVKDAGLEIVDSTEAAFAPIDFTSIYTNAADLKDKALVGPQAQLVTIKGVTIGGQETSSGYYYFELAGKQSYVRISGSTCPLTKDEQSAFKTGHSEHLGWVANVTGVICVYNDAFYLTPVSAEAFEYVSLPTKDDAGMIEFEKENISIPANVAKDTEIDLPAAGAGYSQVTITWASDNACAVVDGGKLKITLPAQNTKVKLTATLTSGTVSQTVDFEINVVVPSTMSYNDIVALLYTLQDGEELKGDFRLYGKVTEIKTPYDEKYGNVSVIIEIEGLKDKPVLCYRMKGDGAATVKVGDLITVEGNLKRYKSDFQLNQGCTMLGIGEVKAAKAVKSARSGAARSTPTVDQMKEWVNAAYEMTANGNVTGANILTGEVVGIATAFKNNEISVFICVGGLSDKLVKLNKMTGTDIDKIACGDTITVEGTLQMYNNSVSVYKGEMTARQAGTAVTAPTDPKKVVDDIFALKKNYDLYYTATVYGKVKEITEVYSSDYQNIGFTIEVQGTNGAQVLLCYRAKGTGVENLKVGDWVTVTGRATNYNGTIELATPAVTYIGDTDPTPAPQPQPQPQPQPGKPAGTGDPLVSGMFAAMVLSAAAIVVLKKKEN